MVGRWSVPEGHRSIRAWVVVGLVGLLLSIGLASAPPADAIQRLPQCADNIDNDGDGRTDFPADPGCTTGATVGVVPTIDETEAPNPATQCSDGMDQAGAADGDVLVDYPLDPGCQSAVDNTEANPTTLPQCGNNNIDDDSDGKVNFSTNPALTDPGCIAASDPAELDTTCSDGIDNDGDGKVDFPFDWGCAVPSATGGLPNQTDGDEADPPQCSDGRDNDGDALIDTDTSIAGQARDPDCASAADNTEAPPPQCSDGADNDGDGQVDAADPGCSSPTDISETDPPAACADTIDNDGDGTVDGADPGCSSPADDDETDPPPPPAVCADGIDNDLDGLIDGADPGCGSATDDDETNVSYPLPPGGGATNTPAGTLLPSGPVPPNPPKVLPTLSPFPVVRLAGRAERTATRVTLLRVVQVPSGSKVTVFCSGGPCPRKRVTQTITRKVGPFTADEPAIRVRPYERRLKVGISLRIFVTKPGFIGKYTRFKILRNKPPSRQDRCARFAGDKPMPCPVG